MEVNLPAIFANCHSSLLYSCLGHQETKLSICAKCQGQEQLHCQVETYNKQEEIRFEIELGLKLKMQI